MTCRLRKVKCDEARPLCTRCAKASIKCDWLEPDHPLPRNQCQRTTTSTNKSRTSTSGRAHISNSTSTRSLVEKTIRPYQSQPVYAGKFSHAARTLIAKPVIPPTSICGYGHNLEINQALSDIHLPLANSLRLDAQDRQCFLHVPHSVIVSWYGKPWKWSVQSYVYANLASRYQGVMRMFIAVAAMELRSQEILVDTYGDIILRDPERAQRLEKSAALHYHLALKDLSVLLDNINNSIGDIEDTDEIDAVFALWYLMLQFGLFDSDTIGWSHVHLEGIGSFLKPYLQSRIAAGKKELPPASQQLLLFISYVYSSLSHAPRH